MTLLDTAVAANVAWCASVSGATGTVPAPGCWLAPPHPPTFFPDLVTTQRGVSAADVVRVLHDRPDCSVKDSYADVDLAPAGFTVLLEATWIGHRPAGPATDEWGTVRDLAAWSAAAGLPYPLPAHLLDDPEVALLAEHRAGRPVAGAAVHRRGRSASVADVFGEDPWPDLLGVLAGLDVVGYEQGTDLDAATAAGLRPLGPLRVWVRSSASAGPAGAAAPPAC